MLCNSYEMEMNDGKFSIISLKLRNLLKKSFGKQYFPLVEFQEDVNLSVRFHLNKKYFSSSLGQMTMDSAHSCRRHDHKATKSTATDTLSAPRAWQKLHRTLNIKPTNWVPITMSHRDRDRRGTSEPALRSANVDWGSEFLDLGHRIGDQLPMGWAAFNVRAPMTARDPQLQTTPESISSSNQSYQANVCVYGSKQSEPHIQHGRLSPKLLTWFSRFSIKSQKKKKKWEKDKTHRNRQIQKKTQKNEKRHAHKREEGERVQSFGPPYLHTKKAATKGHNPVLYLVDCRSLTGSAMLDMLA